AAHDFNNILAVVTASASLISEMSEREDLRKLAKNILDASDNAAKISRQMLGISRRSEFKRQTFEARRLIKGLEAVFQQRTRGSHELELEVERNLWLLADYGQLEQVLLNVFNNAVDALGARDGTVRVHADSQELDMTSAATLGVRPGRYARISVTDSGSGMDEATLERVLEPYFTTKDEGEGTGLGLPMAQGIVEAHDGSLAIQSSVNEGTTVELWLPLTEPRTEVDNSVGLETAPLRTRGGNRLVLLVDNDESVRRAISEMLGFLGYRVVEAAGGAHALELARKTEFDIALLDVHLAFESGSEIARALKKLYPKLNVLMCSGGLDGEESDSPGDWVIRKPFEITTLAAALARFS
ncbi:MAG: ATP-binding protein, partial [Myxococcota bacterium]